MSTSLTTGHGVVSQSEWQRTAREFLDQEKELTRMSDSLARRRRELPWTRVEKDYQFDGTQGKVSLAQLFGGKSQLTVYHFMFGPDFTEGCPGCSYVTDHLNGALEHLAARDVSLVLISRAPLAKLLAFKQRMGWKLPWYSASGCDFNQDFHVTFTKEQVASGKNVYNFGTTPAHGEENPGLSQFYRDTDGTIYHTYSSYGRGLETLLATYMVLDRAPKGRDEDGLPMPMAWLRHHDKYEPTVQSAASCCHSKSQ